MSPDTWQDSVWHHVHKQPKTTVGAITATMAVVALVVTFFRPVPVRGSPEFDFDPIFNIPRPPQDAPFPKTSVIIEQVVMTVSGLLGVLMGGLDAYRAKSLLPLMLPISGAFIAFPEMLLDVVGGLYHPWGPGYWSVKFLGREIVPWISVWFGYGALMQYNLVLLEKNVKTKTLWFYWGIMVLADLIIEEIFLPLGAWIYYGNQPLRVGSLPWWWLPCNSVGVFLATAIAFRFKHHLRGWKALVVLITTPASVGATYGAIALPCWYAVNGDYPWLVTQILGLITMVLGLGLFCLILQILLGRRPFEFDEKCAEDAWEPIAPEQPYHD